jgi:glutaredoxin
LTVKVTAVESLTVPDIVIDGRFVITESSGDETTNVGGVRSTLTVLEIVVVLPIASVATMMILSVPSVKETVVVNVPFMMDILFPLIVKVAFVESETVPVIVIDNALVIKLSFGDCITQTGG